MTFTHRRVVALAATAWIIVQIPPPLSPVERSPDGAAGGVVQPPSVGDLLDRIRDVQGKDMEAWHRYGFRREMVKETLDDTGNVRKRETKELMLTPEKDGGFRELLISLNGGEPSRHAVEQSLRERDFTGKYRALIDKGSGQHAERGFTLDQVLELAGQVLAGEETIEGMDCWRIDFHPVPEEEAGGRVADLIRQAMEGSIWVTRQDLHVVRAKARTVRLVPIYRILAKVYSLEVAMDQIEVDAGVWLPGRIVLDVDRRILFDRSHRHSTWVYSQHERVE